MNEGVKNQMKSIRKVSRATAQSPNYTLVTRLPGILPNLRKMSIKPSKDSVYLHYFFEKIRLLLLVILTN